MASNDIRGARMSRGDRRVLIASPLEAVFEAYDSYLVGSLAVIISKQFFSGVNPGAAFVFTLLRFAAGFAVRPFGSIVFGRIGRQDWTQIHFSVHHFTDGDLHVPDLSAAKLQ